MTIASDLSLAPSPVASRSPWALSLPAPAGADYRRLYSYTFAGRPWIAKEWGSQVLMALAYNAAGWSGVVGLGAAAFGTTAAGLLRLLLQDIRPLPALLFAAGALAMTGPHCLARPFALAFPSCCGGSPV